MTRRFSTVSFSILGASLGAAAPALAAPSMDVKIDLPRLPVAEYHRPYVAVWIEGGSVQPRTVTLWYDAKNREDAGKKWLANMRQWWRKTGRSLAVPADGITAATRAPGPQSIALAANHPALKDLPPGEYMLGVETAREHGGSEAVKVAFRWPPTASKSTSAKGATELGQVTVAVKP